MNNADFEFYMADNSDISNKDAIESLLRLLKFGDLNVKEEIAIRKAIKVLMEAVINDK